METFTKLFASITDSTIWSEDNETRIVWITMLAMCDRHGYVAASVPGLAARARVSIEATEAALAKFMAPDKYSRSQEYEGRRVEAVDRGWNILNHGRFMEMRDEEARREYDRKRKRDQRDRMSHTVPDKMGQSHNVTKGPPPSAHVDVDVDVDRTTTTKNSVRKGSDSPLPGEDGSAGGGGSATPTGESQEPTGVGSSPSNVASHGAPPPATPAEPTDFPRRHVDAAERVERPPAGGGESKADTPAIAGRIGPREPLPGLPISALPNARAALADAEQHRVESARRELQAVGLADQGTIDRLAALPQVTAALVRKVKRENPSAGGGAMARAVSAAAEQAAWANQQVDDKRAKIAQQQEQIARERSEQETAAAEARAWETATRRRIEAMTDAERDAAVNAIIAANPTLAHLRRHEPRTSRFWYPLFERHFGWDGEPAGGSANHTTESRSTQREAEVGA